MAKPRWAAAALAAAAALYAAVTVPAALRPDPGAQTVVFFDGVCHLCDGFVNFVADHDRRRRVRFGAIQRHTDALQRAGAGRYAEGGAEALSTLVVTQGDAFYLRSDAALRVMALLDAPFCYVAVFYALPAVLRDAGYRLVARHRYALFGASDTCRAPTERFKSRFLEYEEPEDAPEFVKF